MADPVPMRAKDYWILLHSEHVNSTGQAMETRVTLRPGEKGTKALVAEYGHRLICVRYRYDAAARLRYKTVELVVEQVPWDPAEHALDPGVGQAGRPRWWECGSPTRTARCNNGSASRGAAGCASSACGSCRLLRPSGWVSRPVCCRSPMVSRRVQRFIIGSLVRNLMGNPKRDPLA